VWSRTPDESSKSFTSQLNGEKKKSYAQSELQP